MSSRDEYIAVIKQAFVTLGKEAAMKYLVGLMPFLSGGIAGAILYPILAHYTELILKGIITGAETSAFFAYIDMRVGKQGQAFEAAAYRNYHAQRGTNEKEKADAEKNLRVELRNFVHFAA